MLKKKNYPKKEDWRNFRFSDERHSSLGLKGVSILSEKQGAAINLIVEWRLEAKEEQETGSSRKKKKRDKMRTLRLFLRCTGWLKLATILSLQSHSTMRPQALIARWHTESRLVRLLLSLGLRIRQVV
jgi:hypothetical protein